MSELKRSQDRYSIPNESIRFFSKRKIPFASCRSLPNGFLVSPVGLGTRFGACDDATDDLIAKVVRLALAIGVNVFDTSPSYRVGRSEKVLGRALRKAFDDGIVSRDELFVVSKAGCSASDVMALTPSAIRASLEDSLRSLKLEYIDLVLIRSPEWLVIESDNWMPQLLEIFALLEEFRSKGKVKWYGISSWTGFLRSISHPLHLPLESILMFTKQVLGRTHGFRFIQLPLSAEMPQAFNKKTQQLRNNQASVLRVASELDLSVLAVAPFRHGQIFTRYPANSVVYEERQSLSIPQWMVQFSRSFPGVASCIVGTIQPEHLFELKILLEMLPWDIEELRSRICS
jgi:aryl-alcohol dehydrogenase-like predicted oxidoreductase